jgi:hypothetical protein
MHNTTDNESTTTTAADILERIKLLEAELHRERDETEPWYEHG